MNSKLLELATALITLVTVETNLSRALFPEVRRLLVPKLRIIQVLGSNQQENVKM